MEERLIAPCGMNCRLCIHYQTQEYQLNKKGFHRKTCPGCIPRGEHCTHLGGQCSLLREGKVRFCTECGAYPCKRLKALDKRYRTKYHMSMLDNLNRIQAEGMDAFLLQEEERWRCSDCGSILCCHNGLCLSCQLEVLVKNKRYRWGEEDVMGTKEIEETKVARITLEREKTARNMNQAMEAYHAQLEKGDIQIAYRGILLFLGRLQRHLLSRHPEYQGSAVYPGTMDMSYFAFTPPGLKAQRLKIAVVYLHEENRLEGWLAGANRGVKKETLQRLEGKDLEGLKRAPMGPGGDAILVTLLDAPLELGEETLHFQELEEKILGFTNLIQRVLPECASTQNEKVKEEGEDHGLEGSL